MNTNDKYWIVAVLIGIIALFFISRNNLTSDDGSIVYSSNEEKEYYESYWDVVKRVGIICRDSLKLDITTDYFQSCKHSYMDITWWAKYPDFKYGGFSK